MNMRSNTQRIKQELADNEGLERCARQCGLIGDVTKLKICYILEKHPELSVGAIAELTGTSVSNVSHCLSRLRDGDMVKCRRDAQTVYYSLTDNSIAEALLKFAK